MRWTSTWFSTTLTCLTWHYSKPIKSPHVSYLSVCFTKPPSADVPRNHGNIPDKQLVSVTSPSLLKKPSWSSFPLDHDSPAFSWLKLRNKLCITFVFLLGCSIYHDYMAGNGTVCSLHLQEVAVADEELTSCFYKRLFIRKLQHKMPVRLHNYLSFPSIQLNHYIAAVEDALRYFVLI